MSSVPAGRETPLQPMRQHGGNVARSALVALACVVTLLSVAAHAEERRLRRGHVDAFVWTPDSDAAARWPVVVFSHGLFLCANQSRFIAEAIAAAGYLVIAPNHADANCSFNREARDDRSSSPASGATSNDADYGDRPRDIRAALDALAADPQLYPRTDLSRVALAGHSLGGYTVLAVAGALPASKLPRVSAILAFAPYTAPLAARGALHDLGAPVMYQVGSLDPVHAACGGSRRRVRPLADAEVLRGNRGSRPLRVDRRRRVAQASDRRLRDRVPRLLRQGRAGKPTFAGGAARRHGVAARRPTRLTHATHRVLRTAIAAQQRCVTPNAHETTTDR